jgi:hypothetical protein
MILSRPSYEERKSLLEHALLVIIDYHERFEQYKTSKSFSSELEHLNGTEILQFYVDFFLAIVGHEFPALLDVALSGILDGATHDSLPTVILLERICNELPFDYMVADGNFDILEKNVDILCQYIWDWRRAKNVRLTHSNI